MVSSFLTIKTNFLIQKPPLTLSHISFSYTAKLWIAYIHNSLLFQFLPSPGLLHWNVPCQYSWEFKRRLSITGIYSYMKLYPWHSPLLVLLFQFPSFILLALTSSTPQDTIHNLFLFFLFKLFWATSSTLRVLTISWWFTNLYPQPWPLTVWGGYTQIITWYFHSDVPWIFQNKYT